MPVTDFMSRHAVLDAVRFFLSLTAMSLRLGLLALYFYCDVDVVAFFVYFLIEFFELGAR